MLSGSNLTENFLVRAPVGAQLALERAAVLARVSPHQLLTRFIVDGLRASGFDLPDAPASNR
jgi:hypothetical protein